MCSKYSLKRPPRYIRSVCYIAYQWIFVYDLDFYFIEHRFLVWINIMKLNHGHKFMEWIVNLLNQNFRQCVKWRHLLFRPDLAFLFNVFARRRIFSKNICSPKIDLTSVSLNVIGHIYEWRGITFYDWSVNISSALVCGICIICALQINVYNTQSHAVC